MFRQQVDLGPIDFTVIQRRTRLRIFPVLHWHRIRILYSRNRMPVSFRFPKDAGEKFIQLSTSRRLMHTHTHTQNESYGLVKWKKSIGCHDISRTAAGSFQICPILYKDHTFHYTEEEAVAVAAALTSKPSSWIEQLFMSKCCLISPDGEAQFLWSACRSRSKKIEMNVNRVPCSIRTNRRSCRGLFRRICMSPFPRS